ncbi:MAG TPA: translocation/assembly module TamB domain-containing protein [Candidatus Eisenbacteria bacterium]|jgi:hypothetical protein
MSPLREDPPAPPPEKPLEPSEPREKPLEASEPGESPAPPEGEPQGLVEEIKEGIEHVTEEIKEEIEHVKEEIEHAVEHVPQPVRWTVSRLFRVVLLSFAALFALLVLTAILYVANRTEWAAKELTVLINQTLARRSDVELEIRDIKGNPFAGVRLLDTTVRFRTGDAPPLLSVETIRVSYSALGLLSGRSPIVLELEHPVIQLARGPDGKLLLPAWKSEPRSTPGRPGRGLDLRLRIARGALRVPRPFEGIEGLALDVRAETGARSRATVESMSWTQGPFGSRLESLRGEIVEGDSVRCLVRELRTSDLELRGRGAWAPGGSERVLALEVARVRWSWLARVFKNGAFDVPGEGRFLAHARMGATLRGDFTGTFDWNGLALEGRGDFVGGRGRWTVVPLLASSPAGDLEGRFTYGPSSWEVGGEVRNGNPARWSAIHLTGWPVGRLNGRFRYRVATAGADELEARLGPSELAGWRADSARVAVLFPASGPDTFRVDMLRRGGQVVLQGVTEKEGWRGRYQAAHLPLEEWPDGRASGIRGVLTRGEGTVEGHHGELRVTGALHGTGTDWLGAHVESWRLEEVDGRLLPKPDLGSRVALAGMTFLGVHFDSTAGAVRLGDAALEIVSAAAHAGDTLVTAAGRATWGQDRWSVTLDRARATSSQFDWTADPKVEISGDRQGVSIDRLELSDRDARLDLGGRWAAPGGAYSFRAHGERLDLSRLGLPSEWGLAGTSEVTFTVGGVPGDPRWSFQAVARGPAARGHRADSLALALSGGPGRLAVDRLALALAGGSLDASGKVEAGERAWPDTLTAEGVGAWISHAGRWEGELRARAFPLERVEALLPKAHGLVGRLDATLTVGGSPSEPQLEVAAAARPLAWSDYRVDSAGVRASYHGGRLTVDEVRVTRGPVESTASGALPLRLGFGGPPELPDQPMDWSVRIPGGDLAVVPLFVPQIGAATGRFDLIARVTGTARHPVLSGESRVRDGVVRLAGREEELRDLSADFSLDESGITLDSLSARQGERGRVAGRGRVSLSGLKLEGYRFDLALRDFTAQESGLYAATFDGAFVVTNGPRVHGQTLPQVSGNAELQHAVVLLDFANQSETQQLAATTRPLFWTYAVQLSATSDLHWQPPDGDIELSADLTIEQTPDSLIIYGDMRSLRGTYYFLSNRFDVQAANLTFDNLNGANPVLDIEAVTRVKQPGAGASCASEGPEEITAKITGRANEPVVGLSSKPHDWDEACILQELTVGRFKDVKGGLSGDPLDSYVTQAINKTLSAEMSRTFKGYINEWVVERERGGLLTGQGDVILGVGIPVSRNLQVRYRQRVPGLERKYALTEAPDNPFERDVEAEYRLNRFFFVTTELKQRRILTGSTTNTSGTPDFNVNLKARWEY